VNFVSKLVELLKQIPSQPSPSQLSAYLESVLAFLSVCSVNDLFWPKLNELIGLLISLLVSSDNKLRKYGFKIVSELIEQDEIQVEVRKRNGLIPIIRSLRKDPQKESSIVILSYLSDKKDVCGMLADLEVIPLLIEELKTPNVTTLSLERGLWAIANFASNPSHQTLLIKSGVVSLLSKTLNSEINAVQAFVIKSLLILSLNASNKAVIKTAFYDNLNQLKSNLKNKSVLPAIQKTLSLLE